MWACATANSFMASSMAPAWMLAGSTSEVSMLRLHLVQQAQAARELRIARARARGVDQHELLAGNSYSSSGSSATS